MIFHGCKNFTEILSKRRQDFPQAIVAGWMTPQGMPVGAAATACHRHPTQGEMAVAWAACLAACLKRIDEMCEEEPGLRDSIMNIVQMTVGRLEVVARLKNDLAKLDMGKAAI